MKSDFLIALTQLAAERNLPREIVLSAIEAALVSAYRKDSVTAGQNVSVKLDPGTGDVTVNVLKSVVDEITDPLLEILPADAKKIKPDAQVGDTITTESIPHEAGRIAAQTAKQVVMQKLREAERELVFEEYSDRDGEVFSVNVQRLEPKQVIVDLGRAEAVLPIYEQVPNERYRPGLKMKVLLQTVERSGKGPELIVSRADRLLLTRLFEMEVPEIYNGAVEIVAIAREPGSRSKVAVRARQDGVDPVGSCVGLRGVRIQNIVNELQGEKIDVVEWSKDPARFIANALSPSQVMRVDLDNERESAVAIVADRLLSLAIGKEGQNARLAARLTGWHVDIKSNVEIDQTRAEAAAKKPAVAEPVTAEHDIERLALTTRTLNILKQAGVTTVGQVLQMSKAELLDTKGFGEKSYGEVHGRLSDLMLLEPVAAPVVEPKEPAVEAPVEEAAEEPAVAEVVEAVEEAVEEPVAEIEVAEVGLETESPVKEAEPAAVDQVAVEKPAESPPAKEEPIPEPAFEEVEEEPEPALERSASLRDVPDNVWSIRRAPTLSPEPGQIRFAEDITGLRGGVTARRTRTGGGDAPKGGKRKTKAGRKRRR